MLHIIPMQEKRHLLCIERNLVTNSVVLPFSTIKYLYSHPYIHHSLARCLASRIATLTNFLKSTNLFHNGSERGSFISAFISTGITAPVGRRNSRCPITLNIEAIDPEWVVNEMYVLSSWVNISSSSFFSRESKFSRRYIKVQLGRKRKEARILVTKSIPL